MNILSFRPFEYRLALLIPLFGSNVRAGFPSPADDYLQKRVDLNEELIEHPAATFFVRVTGDSMVDAGIYDNDTLIVDRSLTPQNGSVIVALLNGDFTVKYFSKTGSVISLKPGSDSFDCIELTEGDDFEVWGVVTNCIHHLR